MPPISRKRRAEPRDDEDLSEDAPQNTQRRRRRGQASDDSGEEGEEEVDVDESMNEAGESLEQLVKKLVRYALACEYSRQPIRREGIRDKVFGKQRHPFNPVFEGAQKQLQTVFGMQMVELPLREKVTLRERRAAAQKSTQTSSASNKSYILITTLPLEYRNPQIIPPSIIPTTHTEASYVGLYTLIISLILLAGGTLGDTKLRRYLQRMEASENTPIDTLENTLRKMKKDGYIVEIKDNTGDEQITDWMVGPRGKMEVGSKGVQGLVRTVYGDKADQSLEKRINSSLGLSSDARDQDGQDEDLN